MSGMTENNTPGHCHSILLIDDDDTFRLAIGQELRRAGFTVLDTASPVHGLELFFTQQPDAVVLDLIMPELSGIEVLEQIMENDSNIPVIVVSAHGELEDALIALRMGACDYLCKGCGLIDELGILLRRNIGEAEAVREKNDQIEALQQEIHALDVARLKYKERVLTQAQELQLVAEIEEKKSKINDMTVTLRTVIQTVYEEKGEILNSIADEVRSSILPTLEKMATEESAETRESFRDVIKEKLFALIDDTDTVMDDRILRLTATELSVAQHIKAGRSTGEIADLMHSSLETIQSHRKNIRKKYDLVGKNISLHVFLRSIKGL